MTTFGELKIVASQDIGELGAKESEPVVYNWMWYYNVPVVFLWVVLLLVLVLVKANRNRRALLIFVPLVIVNFVWLALKEFLFPFPSSSSAVFDALFDSLTVGFAVLLLLSHKLGNRNRFITFLLALAIMVVIGLIGVLSYGMGFSPQSKQILILMGMLSFSVLIGLVMAGWRCKKHYTGLRFILWLALGTVVASVGVMLVCMGITLAHSLTTYWALILLQAFIVGLILGGILYLIVLPYMILAFRSSFFRERFYACLRLKSMTTAPEQKKMEGYTET